MSNIDKRGLREAAEKATKGRWAVEFDDEIYSTDGVNHEQIAMVFSENEARDAATARAIPRAGLPGVVHHRSGLSGAEVREGQAGCALWQRSSAAIRRGTGEG